MVIHFIFILLNFSPKRNPTPQCYEVCIFFQRYDFVFLSNFCYVGVILFSLYFWIFWELLLGEFLLWINFVVYLSTFILYVLFVIYYNILKFRFLCSILLLLLFTDTNTPHPLQCQGNWRKFLLIPPFHTSRANGTNNHPKYTTTTTFFLPSFLLYFTKKVTPKANLSHYTRHIPKIQLLWENQ